MPTNLRLTHKGIILVSVPLVFELAFLGILAYMLNDNQNRISAAHRAALVVGEANSLARNVLIAGKDLVMYRLKRDPRMLQDVDIHLNTVRPTLEHLRELRGTNPSQQEQIATLISAGERCLQLANDYKKHLGIEEGPTRFPGVDGYTNAINKTMGDMLKAINELCQDAKSQADPQTVLRLEEQARLNVASTLFVGVIFNVGLSIFLAWFFSKSITMRLGVLRQNAINLSQKKSLKDRLEGSDEITELDRVFHDMADALLRAEQRKQEFVSMISHDLRTPLTSLQGTLALFAKGSYGALSEKAQKRVESAERSTERLIKMINELLDLEKIDAGMLKLSTERMSIAPVVTRAIESVRGLAEENGVVLDDSDVADVMLNVDEERMTQVLINLLSNAIKYTQRGKMVWVRARTEGNAAVIEVADQGIGIPSDHIEKIFDRFQRVERGKEKYASTGLGLAITKAMVEAHGGTLTVHSQEGEGTTFTITVPSIAAVSAPSKPPAAISAAEK